MTSVPADRWPLQRHWHPRLAERGRTYTWAAGVLDDIWGFDAAAFGISPREAEQMDPQQRLLLELVWEALEDGGIRPSSLAGSDAGVFVGASSVDHANLRLVDMAAADAYMMTGNTLSVVSNRISYIFDLHGPSFTVDTACSSSLVAVNEAVASLRSGRIDTAIVAGVNLLVSPQSFIGFSQAAMLSRLGLCQAFSAHADGYVRAEGGVVLVLRTSAAAARDGNTIHGVIVDADVNSDGRTNGISLPSKAAQAGLLSRLYDSKGIDPGALAFVEAHGTGTPVGDPIEAAAIGEVLGKRRHAPLPIGSLKTNIGHMEAAAGLGGVLKAMLALEHGLLPASLHSAQLNPAIDFAGLNLEVARRPIELDSNDGQRRLAGVNAFGFGGTNAHVILADAPATAPANVDMAPSFLVVSAHCRAALGAIAGRYAAHLRKDVDDDANTSIAAAAARRDRLAHRLVMPVGRREDMIRRLESPDDAPGVARGSPVAGGARVAFVFSGNGSQFAGMGLPAYRRNTMFRDRLDTISVAFEAIAGWSIVEALHAEDLSDRLRRAQVAQPLLFAIQSAASHTLRELGLAPAMVLGHSVGEVAAAEAAGLLDAHAALRTIYERSRHQELTYEHGGMAVVIGPEAAIGPILDELPGLEIAAFNSPRAFTVSGDEADLVRLSEVARRFKARARMLDLAYPFHSALMSPVEAPLKEALADLSSGAPQASFISTVSGGTLGGDELDAHYWWRNVREPVRFSQAVAVAREKGAGIFVEIGPMAALLSHIGDCLDEGDAVATFATLDKQDKGVDPIAMTVASAIARGAIVDETKTFGSAPSSGAKVSLPHYAWQRKPYRLAETLDTAGIAWVGTWHPLIGARAHPERLEWHCVLDTALHPWLADHRVDGQAIVPGAAFVEMAFAAAREWCGGEQAILSDLEIAAPLQLTDDAGRDVLCRISPLGSLIEILSRPRLSASPWQRHVTAKIVRDTTIDVAPDLAVAPESSHDWVDGATIYASAERAGLCYGPAFRRMTRARWIGSDAIAVELAAGAPQLDFGIDPVALDACFHALLLAFQDRPADTGYVPVHFGEIILVKPGALCSQARIDVRRCDARAAVIDVTLASAAGEVVAMVRDARFRPFRGVRSKAAVDQIVQQIRVLALEPTAARRDPPLALDALRATIKRESPQSRLKDEYVLLEGWATSLALVAMSALATDGVVEIDDVIASGRISMGLRPWLARCLVALERSGLCRPLGRGYVFDVDAELTSPELPSPDEILAAIARNHQPLGVELLTASSVQAHVRAIIAGESAKPLDRLVAEFEDNAVLLQAPALALADIVRTSIAAWPRDRATRILQVGCGPLTLSLVALAETASAKLTIFDPDSRRLERTRLALAHAEVDLVDRIDESKAAAFDLVLSATPCPAGLASVRRLMSPEGILAVVEPPPSFFRDFVRGLDDPPTASHNANRTDWRAIAIGLGLEAIETDEIETSAGASRLLTARMPAERRHRAGSGAVVIVGDAQPSSLQTSFATLLASSGLHVSIGPGTGAARLAEMPRAIVVFAHAEGAFDAAARVREHCMRLKLITDEIGERASRLWFVFVNSAHAPTDGIVSALCAFSRTLANERPMLDIRRVEVAADVRPDDLVERLHDLILSETEETEIVLDATSTRVTRFVARPLRERDGVPAECARLLRSDSIGVDRLRWHGVERDGPGSDEVEIAVEASGVNFRDVMFGLGLLPDDILEHGFAGPTLGLECAGRVLRVGERVANVRAGDRVMAFARNAFSTHVVTPASLVVPIPDDVETAAAATIPVAFMTAYYGLMACARLKPREWVLIHGGAGGVGLAALQIARWRGARVIATAGSPGKRALLRSLGAEHAFDSRSGRFVDEVRRVTGEGVAVVLNSLSGDAMERSIAVLRPFGRFIELGKRDYVANTHIGLRPFRRNLSYFGVDLDQLLVDAPQASRRLLRAVMRLFERGKLMPLPYRIIEASQTIEAFRLMQQSGHVGKLVVRPPSPSSLVRPVPETPLRFATDKTHLVTGGFGGFGLATARWLAANGARSIVLIGRSGAASEEARSAVADLTAQGADIIEAAVDVADRKAMQSLFVRFGRDLPPLAGVIHAAMVLDDALLADLTPERIETVLRPKVAGADHLDQLTLGLPLDYFILYSSVTTVLGNPGQAAYVAANGYLEGLARRRRRDGRPALAVAWGAISDVGVLARAEKTRGLLESRAGIRGLSAEEALRALGSLLTAGHTDDGVVTVAPLSWSKARQHLAILGAPAYRSVVGRDDTMAAETGKVDIAALVCGATPEAAHRTVVQLIVEEIARVLRLPAEDVGRKTPLSEIGLDSLMAVELALGLESRFTLAAPLSTTASGFTVNELADHIIAIAAGTPASDDMRARQLMGRHLGPAAIADRPDGAAEDAAAMA